MSSCSVINDSIAQRLEPGAMEDDLLVEAAQAGQEWAFVELCTRNSKRVFNTIYGVTKNREDAEDALQDSMMRAFLHLKQFDGRSSFATWFTRIGINSALMILRKRRIRLETSIDATAEGETWQTWQIADYSADPEKHYAGHERSLHLKRAICRLPNALRIGGGTGTDGGTLHETDCPQHGYFHSGDQVPAGARQSCAAQVDGGDVGQSRRELSLREVTRWKGEKE